MTNLLYVPALVCALTAAARTGDDIPLDEMLTIMNSVYDQYRSITCEYRVQSSAPGESYSGKYYLEVGKRLRSVCERNDLHRHDIIIKNGVRYNHNRHTRKLEINPHASADTLMTDCGIGDLWSMMGLMTSGVKPGLSLTYAEMLREDRIKKRCYYDTEKNIVLEIDWSHSKNRVVLSRRHGYLPLSLEAEGAIGRLREKGEVRTNAFGSFNGVFMATKRTSRGTVGDKEDVTEFTFSNIKINEPIPDEVFKDHACPPGTQVVDSVKQVVDRIDANGRRVGTDWKYVDGKLNIPTDVLGVVTQTTDEPRQYSLIAIPAASVLVAALAVVLYLRRR